MAEQPDEIRKLVSIATDPELALELRTKATKSIGNIGTHDALLALLDLAANDKLNKGERELALKHAKGIIKLGR